MLVAPRNMVMAMSKYDTIVVFRYPV